MMFRWAQILLVVSEVHVPRNKILGNFCDAVRHLCLVCHWINLKTLTDLRFSVNPHNESICSTLSNFTDATTFQTSLIVSMTLCEHIFRTNNRQRYFDTLRLMRD